MRVEDPIRAPVEGKVAISNHADEEAQNDGPSFDEIYFSANRGEIIEEYLSMASGATTGERGSRS